MNELTMAKDGWMDDSFIVRLRDEQMLGIFRVEHVLSWNQLHPDFLLLHYA